MKSRLFEKEVVARDYSSILNKTLGEQVTALDLLVYYQAMASNEQVSLLDPFLARHEKTLKKYKLWGYIEADRLVWEKSNPESGLFQLIEQLAYAKENSYLRAEIYFSIGLAFEILRSFSSAKPFFKKSHQLFKDLKLPTHSWYSTFNLALISRNLGHKESHTEHINALVIQTDKMPLPSLGRCFWLLSCEMAATGNFKMTVDFQSKAAEAYLAVEDLHGYAQVLFDRCTIGLKLNSKKICLEAISSLEQTTWPTKELQIAASYLVDLMKSRLVSSGETKSLVMAWLKSSIQPLRLQSLIEVLLMKLLKSSQYKEILDFIHFAKSNKISIRFPLPLLPVSYFECYSLYKTGDSSSYFSLLSKLSTSSGFGGEYLAISLKRELKQLPFKDLNQKLYLVNPTTHTLTCGQTIVNLATQPLVERFLVAMSGPQKTRKLSEVFEQIYNISYLPSFHKARLNSLINRAEVALGRRKVFTRKSDILSIHASIEIRHTTKKDDNISFRRQTVVKFISKNKSVSTKDLVSFLGVEKRTLQNDLKALVSENRIQRLGHGRLTRYKVLE